MADKIIIFSGKQYSGKDTLAKILLENIDVLCNYIDNKNIKKFLNLFELRNCRVFLDKGCKDICMWEKKDIRNPGKRQKRRQRS